MRFDFITFFEKNRVSYVSRGADVARGNVNIHCPFCGAADEAQHMGVNLQTGHWGCWRDSMHRGKKPHRLIQALLKCTWEQVELIVGDGGAGYSDWGEMKAQLERKVAPGVRTPPPVAIDPDFHPILRQGMLARFYHYLQQRGFDSVDELSAMYELKGCLSGRFGGRLVIPFIQRNLWVGWTGRAIGRAEVRYLSYPSGPEVKKLVFNADCRGTGGEWLLIVEGPLDCLKLDYYGRRYGIRAVGLLGSSATESQANILLSIATAFDNVGILLDSDAIRGALTLKAKIISTNPKIFQMPEEWGDPGALPGSQVMPFLRSLIK